MTGTKINHNDLDPRKLTDDQLYHIIDASEYEVSKGKNKNDHNCMWDFKFMKKSKGEYVYQYSYWLLDDLGDQEEKGIFHVFLDKKSGEYRMEFAY